jgi:hypothetical protein
VRISSVATFQPGHLIIIDVKHAPVGCSGASLPQREIPRVEDGTDFPFSSLFPFFISFFCASSRSPSFTRPSLAGYLDCPNALVRYIRLLVVFLGSKLTLLLRPPFPLFLLLLIEQA